MKRSSAELKSLARETLKGKYGTFIGTAAIYALIVFGASLVVTMATSGIRGYTSLIVTFCLQLVLVFVWMIFSVGFIHQSMQACRGQAISITDLFYGFSHNPDRYIVLSLLMTLIAVVMLLPFIILFVIADMLGGSAAIVMMAIGMLFYIAAIVFLIILTYGLALCYYLILDNPGMTAIASMKESWKLMKGNKGRFFYISLSFIGMSLLAMLTCGIGMLWVTPYMNVTTAYFYFDVIGKLDAPTAPVPEVASATPIVPVAPPVNPVAKMVPVDETPVEPVAPVEPVETPVVETPVVDETPVVETPVGEAPVVEAVKEEVVNVAKQANSDAPYVDDPVIHNPAATGEATPDK